jgi:hypothetical protein
MTSAENSLRLVKLGHTIIWAIFAGSISPFQCLRGWATTDRPVR